MKIGILGGGNVYALNLAKHLHEQGIDHFGIGRSRPKPEAFWVKHHYRYWTLHLVDQLQAVMGVIGTERPDVIVNFAAQGEGQGSFGDKTDLFYQTNTLGLVRLVEKLRTQPYLKRFIQIGTSELYGSVASPSKETDPIKPSSPYAVSKAAFDLHLEIMHRVHCFPMNVIRPSNCIAEGQQLHRIVPRAIVCALTGSRLPLQGGGRAQKSYLHATDLSRAVLTVLVGPPGEIYNCGPEEPISIADLVYAVARICGISYEDLVEATSDRVGQDGCYWLDSSKLKELGWARSISLSDGVENMVKWIKTYPEILTMDPKWEIRP